MVVLLNGEKHRIALVNECRARAVPLAKKRTAFKTLMGKSVAFMQDRRAVNISPNSEVPILS
jgi:hypothetical protein